MNEFDSKAIDWDKNNLHVERSEAIAASLLKRLLFRKEMKAMEYGAGTGLLSFLLKDRVSEITLIDNSAEMLRIAQDKIDQQHIEKMKTVLLNLENEDYPGKFDVIFSQMVFHHVNNIGLILDKFIAMLNPGGFLAIADLYIEDGSFHGSEFTGHKGFDPEKLKSAILNKGFISCEYDTCFVIRKPAVTSLIKEYPVFLMVAAL
jgi:tRNA (cmo5U34)-methyltransferase